MIIKRDDRILGARYLSREGDTGTRWWSAMRGRNRLSVFNDSMVSSEVALDGRPGQLVFSTDEVPPPVYPPGENIPTPVPSWSPISLGPYIWLDATDGDTVETNVGFMTDWYDKSGNNRDFVGGDGSNSTRPTITNINGKNFIDCGPFVPSLSGKFVTSNTLADAFANRVFAAVVESGAGGGFVFGYYSSVFGTPFHRGDPGYGANSYDPVLSAAFADARWKNGVFRMNGTAADPTAVGLSGGVDILIFKSTGAYSAENINALNCDRSFRTGGGKYGEVINWDDSVSLGTPQFELLEGYLAHKFGIASKLPPGHPYKAAPP